MIGNWQFVSFEWLQVLFLNHGFYGYFLTKRFTELHDNFQKQNKSTKDK